MSGFAEYLDAIPQLAARLRIESGRRFIEKHERWPVNGGNEQRQALLLAAGKLLEPLRCRFVKFESPRGDCVCHPARS